MGKILGTSKISSRYQVAIPEDVRKHMKLKEGDHLLFVQEDDKVVILSQV